MKQDCKTGKQTPDRSLWHHSRPQEEAEDSPKTFYISSSRDALTGLKRQEVSQPGRNRKRRSLVWRGGVSDEGVESPVKRRSLRGRPHTTPSDTGRRIRPDGTSLRRRLWATQRTSQCLSSAAGTDPEPRRPETHETHETHDTNTHWTHSGCLTVFFFKTADLNNLKICNW